MTRNNKGFSLIELIIAFAILAIAGITIFSFVKNTSYAYKQSHKEIKLQYEHQMAVTQVRDMIVEAERGIYYDTANTMLVLYGENKNVGGSAVYPVTAIRYMAGDGKLYFHKKDFANPTDVDLNTLKDDVVAANLVLAEAVKSFDVDLSHVSKDKVTFFVTFFVGEKEQMVTETVALRNQLLATNTVDDIWEPDPDVVDSYIQGIEIQRGSTIIPDNGDDIIGKFGASVVISYTAKVRSTAESSREYAINWTLEDAVTGISLSQPGGVQECEVTVLAGVPTNTTFKLQASSVDDPTKTCTINIRVLDVGIYPETATLSYSGPIEGNGYLEYKLLPALHYSNETAQTDYSYFSWIGLEDLPAGCSFDDKTGQLIIATEGTYKVQVRANERDSQGQPIYSNEITINVEEVPKYVVGLKGNIVVDATIDRGGYIFPSMEIDNGTGTNYTYSWMVEPYHDSGTVQWDAGEVSNSTFNLISLADKGGYEANNVKHVMQVKGKNSLAINCAEWLNWSKTFKFVLYATAVDENETVVTAEPQIITINPVEIQIEKTDVKSLNISSWEWDNNKPILTSPTLRYEDWYWDNKEKGTDNAKQSPTRRWFTINAKNLNMTGNNLQGCTIEMNYLLRNQVGKELSNNYVGVPTSRYDNTHLLCGFSTRLYKWEHLADRPIQLNCAIRVKDQYGNEKISNLQIFTILYSFYDPTVN